MDTTYAELIKACPQHPSPNQATLLAVVLTLAQPHELLDHRTYVTGGSLIICDTRAIPLGTAAAHVLGGDGPTSERLPRLQPDSDTGWLDGRSGDPIAAAAIKAALEAARTSGERRAVLAYCGLTGGDADLELAAHLIDDVTRQAGYRLPTPAGRHLRVVG